MPGGNDYGRRHWVTEPELDFNSSDATTRNGPDRAPRAVRGGTCLQRLGPVAQPFRARRRGGAIVRGALRSLGHPLSYRADRQRGGREDVVDKSKSHSEAVERFRAAREERDRRAGLYEAASGSPGSELSAFTELQAAEEQLAAREAWLKWTERDY
jgi:hypothetical protein